MAKIEIADKETGAPGAEGKFTAEDFNEIKRVVNDNDPADNPGPKGDQGAAGEKGDKGDQGDAGADVAKFYGTFAQYEALPSDKLTNDVEHFIEAEEE